PGPARLRQGRRAAPRREDRRVPAAESSSGRRHNHDEQESSMSTTTDRFPTDPTGLPDAAASEPVELRHGDELALRIAPVAKRLNGDTVRMLAYNGSIPGPTLRVKEGSEVVVNVENVATPR